MKGRRQHMGRANVKREGKRKMREGGGGGGVELGEDGEMAVSSHRGCAKFGVVSAAFGNVKSKEGKLDETPWVKEMVRNNRVTETWKIMKDRREMLKPSTAVRCTLVNGSAWCTEKNHMRWYKGTSNIFLKIEHRTRKEELEKQFNKQTKQESRFATYAATITDENASSEDCNHPSRVVFVAINRDLRAVVDKEEGAVTSLLGKRMENRPSVGDCQRRYAGLCCFFCLRQDVRREMRH